MSALRWDEQRKRDRAIERGCYETFQSDYCENCHRYAKGLWVDTREPGEFRVCLACAAGTYSA